MLLWASKFGTVKIECNFQICKWTPLGVTFGFAGDGTFEGQKGKVVFLSRETNSLTQVRLLSLSSG